MNDNLKNDLCDNISSEINECRQDERDSQNQVLQVISAAATALTVIYAVSALLNQYGDDSAESVAFMLSIFVFFAAMPYMTTLGIGNILRFQYVRYLEDRLVKERGQENSVLGWMNFSSPITTRNILHIKTPTTFFHFFCYELATFSAIAFCIVLTCIQYWQLSTRGTWELVLIVAEFAMTIFLIFVFIFTSVNAPNIMRDSLERATLSQAERLHSEESPHKRSNSFVKYLLYPRINDLQKGGLIPLGYIMGMIAVTSTIHISNLKHLFVTWLVFEFLGYQARYQINDLRGVRNDNGKRLPNPQKNAGLSAVVAALKVLSAFFIAFNTHSQIMISSLVILCVITILYEFVRFKSDNCTERNENFWDSLLLFSVSLGYPLRFFSGFLVAVPWFWGSMCSIDGIQISLAEKIVITISIALFGEYSVLFPWHNDAKTSQLKTKKYLIWINQIPTTGIKCIVFVLSVCLLTVIKLYHFCSPFTLVFELCILACSVLLCLGALRTESQKANPTVFILLGGCLLVLPVITKVKDSALFCSSFSRFLFFYAIDVHNCFCRVDLYMSINNPFALKKL